MTEHFQREIEKLKQRILALSSVVENSVRLAMQALEEKNMELAKSVIDDDEKIDEMEVDVEEECLKILALHQPVAIDLRFIVATLKINNDLERIGDEAVNIAERAEFLASRPPLELHFEFAEMARASRTMLKESLDSLVNMDAQLARKVCNDDDVVDDLNREMFEAAQVGMQRDPEHMNEFIHLMSASRHLERIADLATNIAEDVIYMVEGRIVRHNKEILRQSISDA